MNKTALYGLLIALVLPVVAYMFVKNLSLNAAPMPRHINYDSVTNRIVKGKRVVDTVWHTLPDVKFTNQLGQTVTFSDIGNKVIVADFFFTRCPSICPQMTLNMKRLQTGITKGVRVGDKQADFVHYLSISVDPERDSVQNLKQWANRYNINPETWWLVTGNKKEIYDLSIKHMLLGAEDGNGIDTSFFHSDRMVLIDRNRQIRGSYRGLDTMEIARLSRDIVLLSLEKDPKRKSFLSGKLELIALIFVIAAVGGVLFTLYLKKDRRNGTNPSKTG